MEIRFVKIVIYLTALILTCASSLVYGADQNLFEVSNLEIEGRIYGFVDGDVNGDGRGDVLIVYSTALEFQTRYLGVYLQNGSGRYSLRPDYLMTDLPRGAAQINCEDIDGDGKDEIIAVASDGVWAIKFNPNGAYGFASRQLISEKTIFTFPLFNGILNDRFLFDITGDPIFEIVIPIETGYAIYELGEGDEYQILNKLKAPISCHISGKGLSEFAPNSGSGLHLELAEISIIDGNGDGARDIYMLWDRNACVYFQDETGNFSSDPSLNVNVFSPHTRGLFQSRIYDFNGDGAPDLAVSNTTGGITSAETHVRFHLAGAGGRLEQYFRKELSLSDSHSNLMIGDFNRDGVPEMAVPAIELGALAVTQMFLMKKTDLHLLIYPLINGVPDEEPKERIKYEFRFNFDDPLPTGEVSLDWSSDFNGDGLPDLIFIGGNGKVSFYWGDRDDYLSERPDIELALERPSRAYAASINSGGGSDLIIEHRMDGRFDRLTVLINKSN